MAQFRRELFQPTNFNLAFEQMCNFAAIAKTSNADDTLKQIILQCFVVLPDEKFQNAKHLTDAITVFGLQIPEFQVQVSLNKLITEGRLLQSADSNLGLPNGTRAYLKQRIDDAKVLEERVKNTWIENISRRFPSLPPEKVWQGLQGYLSRTFRCHGLQTAALLDNTIDIAPAYAESIFSLLNESLHEIFPPALFAPAREAILSFFVSLNNNLDQKMYIQQLEDGVFNYFSLMVDPEIAARLQKQLNRLTIFLDTNFLFNVLGIDEHNYYVDISKEIVSNINNYKLPFKLRYHPATGREMHETISLRENELRKQEKAFFHRNGATPLDAEAFRKRFEHVEVLLKDQNITVYRSQFQKKDGRSELLEKYRSFLATRGRMKPNIVIEHDMDVLDAVHQIRSKSTSTLEAEALFLTCDILLYVFDWEISKQQNRSACTVLPDSFLQVMLPFLSSSDNFERSFGETFVIPEFRAIESKSNEARTKMLSYLKAYEDLPIETATKLLSNDLLLEPLRPVEDDQFHQYLDSIVQEQKAATLLEEKVAVEKQLEKELAEKEALEKRLEQERIELEKEKARADEEKARADKAEQLLRRKEKELTLPAEYTERGNGHSQDQDEIYQARTARVAAEGRAKEGEFAKEDAERKVEIHVTITAIAISLLLIGLFEFTLHYVFKWSSPHIVGLQVAFNALILFCIVGAFNSKWRVWCWGVAAFAIVGIIIQMLG
jgi:hypothetical protein